MGADDSGGEYLGLRGANDWKPVERLKPKLDTYTCKAGHHWAVPLGKVDLELGLENNRTVRIDSICLTC